MQSQMVTFLEIPSLPLQVKRWMLQQDEQRFDECCHLGTPTLSKTLWGHRQIYCQGSEMVANHDLCLSWLVCFIDGWKMINTYNMESQFSQKRGAKRL
jgi:hypothetical protein